MAERDIDSSGLADHVARTQEELSEFASEAADTALTIEEAFTRAGTAIESSLVSAARSGEVAFTSMAQTVLTALSNLAVERFVRGPLADLLAGIPFPRLRADGGPVTSGDAYLVGERGPELFVPSATGLVAPQAGAGVTVNLHIASGADADVLRRSQGQIATLVARAVARGQKRL